MHKLFQHNWTVREQWFQRLAQVSHEELVKERDDGYNPILKTLLHIVEVEFKWLIGTEGKEVQFKLANYPNVPSIWQLSASLHPYVQQYLMTNRDFKKKVYVPWQTEPVVLGDIYRHLIVHEIHHFGQLSVWAKEIGIEPVKTNFFTHDFTKLHEE